MKMVFGFGLFIESLALVWFIYQIWLLYTGRSDFYEEAYPELYRKNIIPAILLFVIILSAIIAQFWFKSPKIAMYIVISPAIIFVLALAGMMITSMFIRDWK